MHLRRLAAAPGLVACCTLGLLAVLASGAAPDEYSIKLAHPAKVGERTRIHGTRQIDNSMAMTIAGKEKRDEKHALYHIDAVQQVMAVGAKGNVTQAELVVRELAREAEDGTTTALLEPGKVISIHRQDGENVWELGGKPLDPELREVLTDVDGVSGDDDPSNDEVFGTARPRHVGDTWQADGDLVVRQLGRRGITVLAKDVKGGLTLREVNSFKGVPRLTLRLDVRVNNAIVPGSSFPEGLKLAPITVSMTGLSVVSATGDQGVLAENLDLQMPIHASGTIDGAEVTFDGSFRRISIFQHILEAQAPPQER